MNIHINHCFTSGALHILRWDLQGLWPERWWEVTGLLPSEYLEAETKIPEISWQKNVCSHCKKDWTWYIRTLQFQLRKTQNINSRMQKMLQFLTQSKPRSQISVCKHFRPKKTKFFICQPWYQLVSNWLNLNCKSQLSLYHIIPSESHSNRKLLKYLQNFGGRQVLIRLNIVLLV